MFLDMHDGLEYAQRLIHAANSFSTHTHTRVRTQRDEIAISKRNIRNSEHTYKLLKKQIAIPILLKRSEEEYINLSEKLFCILSF